MPVDMNKLVDLDRLKEYKTTENNGIAPIETTSTASKAYKTGERFYFQGKLCIATNDIAQGGTITLNTNCKLDVLGDDVSELKTALKSVEDGFAPIDLMLIKNTSIRFESSPLVPSDYNFPITVLCSNQNYSFYVMFYNSDGQTISNIPWQKTKYMLFSSDVPSNTATFKVICKADDEHNLSETEKAYFSAYSIAGFYVSTPKTVYVSATNGLDSNDGSKLLPLKTITKAINLNATTILVEPGTYSERLNISDKHDLKIMPWGYGTFATGDADKKIVLDGINTRPLLLLFENCSNITLIGVAVINFTSVGVRMTNCSGMKYINCEAGNLYGTYQYGIGFELINTNADFESCYVHDVTLDGFNIHGFGTTRFVNCIAKNCGDDGISHHDACVGYISGGEYSNCGKGGIASPTYGAYVNVDSVYCHDNLYGIYIVSNSSNRASKAIISNCASKDNTNKDIYIDYAEVTGWNNLYATKTVGSNATFTEIS